MERKETKSVRECVYEVLGLASAIARERSNDSFYPLGQIDWRFYKRQMVSLSATPV